VFVISTSLRAVLDGIVVDCGSACPTADNLRLFLATDIRGLTVLPCVHCVPSCQLRRCESRTQDSRLVICSDLFTFGSTLKLGFASPLWTFVGPKPYFNITDPASDGEIGEFHVENALLDFSSARSRHVLQFIQFAFNHSPLQESPERVIHPCHFKHVCRIYVHVHCWIR
jgi:hypothetical protein